MGNVLEFKAALSKEDLKKRDDSHKNENAKDSRNLYLVKEGVILAGTKAAEEVSAPDMTKRLQIEQYKTQILRNLNMFVSRTRLIVHNVPASWDDKKLRELFTKYSSNAVIKEARIMRNLKMVDGWGVAKSKEYGFVMFATHEAALRALRAVNNNPEIFSKNKRPIVAFSIENRAKLRARERRLENSRVRNLSLTTIEKGQVKTDSKRPKNSFKETTDKTDQFSGTIATPGNKSLRTKYNLQTQAQLHREELKKVKKTKMNAKKTLVEKRKEFTKQPRQKINKKKALVSDNFSKMVNDYKNKLLNVSGGVSKQKWYE